MAEFVEFQKAIEQLGLVFVSGLTRADRNHEQDRLILDQKEKQVRESLAKLKDSAKKPKPSGKEAAGQTHGEIFSQLKSLDEETLVWIGEQRRRIQDEEGDK